jgi:hypothetical protein
VSIRAERETRASRSRGVETVTLPGLPVIYQGATGEAGVADGPGEVAERVVQALEAADGSVAGLPASVAGMVLVALGSSAGDHEDLAAMLAGLFRADLVGAVESVVRRALLSLGSRQGRQ